MAFMLCCVRVLCVGVVPRVWVFRCLVVDPVVGPQFSIVLTEKVFVSRDSEVYARVVIDQYVSGRYCRVVC
eukprot:6466331-Prorocentrum_lima.AAC.1